MKHAALLLLATLALSSCATKNYMVGSANDRNRPPRVPGAAAVAAMNGTPLNEGAQPWGPVEDVHPNPNALH